MNNTEQRDERGMTIQFRAPADLIATVDAAAAAVVMHRLDGRAIAVPLQEGGCAACPLRTAQQLLKQRLAARRGPGPNHGRISYPKTGWV